MLWDRICGRGIGIDAAVVRTLTLVAVLFSLSTSAQAALGAETFSYVGQFGGHGTPTGAGVFNTPSWTAVDAAHGWVYVSDPGAAQVQRFDLTGQPANFTAGPGTGTNVLPTDFSGNNGSHCASDPYNYLSDCFVQPEGLAVDPSTGDLWVVDTPQSVVDEFSPTGAWIATYGQPYDPPATDNLVNPTAVAVTANNHVYITDSSDHVVVELKASDGSFVRTFGTDANYTATPSNGMFESPTGIAATADATTGGQDDVWITDSYNDPAYDRVDVWTTTASSATAGTPFGSQGTGTSQFYPPSGIAYSPGDGGLTPASVFVVDEGNQRVEQFTPTGAYIGQFGSIGGGNGQFNDPVGVAINPDESGLGTTLYVADDVNSNVQKFAPEQPPVNNSLPVVSGTDQQGSVLTTTNGSWANAPNSYSYAWEQCDSSGSSCTPITNATASSYTVQAGDIGHTLTACVTASNSAGPALAAACSIATAVIVGAPPANTAPPVVSGTTTQGDVLSGTSGSWSNWPTSYRYQWQRCDAVGDPASCQDILAANTTSAVTSTTYTVQAADVGSRLRLCVTASPAVGPASEATCSALTALIAAAPAGTSTITSVQKTAVSGPTTTTTKTLLSSGIPVTIETVANAQVHWTLVVDRQVAMQVHLGHARSVIVGKGTSRAPQTGTIKLHARLTAKGRHGLKRLHHGFWVTLRMTFTLGSSSYTISRRERIRT